MEARPKIRGTDRQVRYLLDLVVRGRRLFERLAEIEPKVRGCAVHDSLSAHMRDWRAFIDAWEAMAEGRVPSDPYARDAFLHLGSMARWSGPAEDAGKALARGVDAGSAIDIVLTLLREGEPLLARAEARAGRSGPPTAGDVHFVGSPRNVRLAQERAREVRAMLDFLERHRDAIARSRNPGVVEGPMERARVLLDAWDAALEARTPDDPDARWYWEALHTDPDRHAGPPRDVEEAVERGINVNEALPRLHAAYGALTTAIRSLREQGLVDEVPPALAREERAPRRRRR